MFIINRQIENYANKTHSIEIVKDRAKISVLSKVVISLDFLVSQWNILDSKVDLSWRVNLESYPNDEKI